MEGNEDTLVYRYHSNQQEDKSRWQTQTVRNAGTSKGVRQAEGAFTG